MIMKVNQITDLWTDGLGLDFCFLVLIELICLALIGVGWVFVFCLAWIAFWGWIV